MNKEDFSALRTSLQDAVAYLNGDMSGVRATVIDAAALDITAIRKKVRLSQDDFARVFGVSLGTLRNWEQRRNRPDGPACALLTAIDRDPASVLKALRIVPTQRKVPRTSRITRSSAATRRPPDHA